ncbi:MAG: hypothetical protein LBQ35_00100, partial [Spirochaetaceae bacterium]|nr:hypothetical protein [Spirochaetaceae bacterium]
TITASYAEWEALVNALDSWIKAPSAAGVSLSGKAYTLRPAKTALTENLNGVFAVMGAEQWTYGDHLINIPLNAAFSSVNDAANASAERLRDLTKPLIEYARALDFKTRHLAGKNGPASRGQDLVSPANFGYDQTVQIFAEGKALFLKQGNWAYNNIANINRETAERLSFLPVKMPFAQSDITAPGVTVEKLNRSIPAFVPNYYAVNALARESEKKAAYDFLVWMNTTPAGQRFVVDEMAFIPYNADPAVTRVSNSLGNSIISYMAKGDTMPDVWHGFPVTWAGDIAGRYIKENYLVKAAWTEADYEQFASYAVEQLIELRK